jgi:murein DD-endopeptidase MepM/ murein hydrolase activator NlpD
MGENTNTRAEAAPESGGRSGERAAVGGDRSVPRRAVEWLANRNSFALMGVLFAMGFVANEIPPLDPYDDVFFILGAILPILLATVSTAEDGHRADTSAGDRVRFLLGNLRWGVTPWGIVAQILQVAGTLTAYVRYLGRLPSRDRHVPGTTLAPPFDGEWTTVNGGVTKPTSHSWGIVSQRYAYDFVVTDADGDTHTGEGDELADYHAYGRPVRAPADGTVVAVQDGLRDHPNPGTGWVEWRTWRITGNYVVVRHPDGEYSLLAHLREGSVAVTPGDEVQQGDVLGECGNSGISTEPHLHYQLMDHRNFWFAAGLVPEFIGATVSREDDRRAGHEVYAPAGSDRRRYLWAGDRVGPAAAAVDAIPGTARTEIPRTEEARTGSGGDRV